MRGALGLAVLLAVLATLPSDAWAASEEARKVGFICDGGQLIAVTFNGRTASLETGQATVRLDQQRVASGIHYAGGGHDLRGKGPEIIWTDNGRVARTCRDQQDAVPTAADFRSRPAARRDALEARLFRVIGPCHRTVVPPNVQRYALEFRAGSALAMQLDCNRAAGR